MRYALIAITLLAVALDCAADEKPTASTPDKMLRIYALPKQVEDRLDGCSCSFSLRKVKKNSASSEIIGWRLGDDTTYMQINGMTEELKLVQTIDQPKHQNKAKERDTVGDRTKFILKNNSWKVTVGCVVNSTCDDCESIGYTGQLVVKGKERALRVPIEGACGC